LSGWLAEISLSALGLLSAFDFPLRYKLKDVCDTPNYGLRKLTGGESSILHADPHLYIMRRHGTDGQSGLIYVLNNLENQERHLGEDEVDKSEVQAGGMGWS
jgi:hypothetical protein